MPRSKRAKLVHLSKTTKKGKDHTRKIHAAVQECIPLYPYIYVFRVDGMRNNQLKTVRSQLSADSRLMYGKTKVMALALGRTPESEPFPNTSLLSAHLQGDVGLLFSKRPPEDVQAYFLDFRPLDYARSGATAPRSFTVPAGVVFSRAGEIADNDDLPVASAMEPTLRKLGMPTRLVKGRVELETPFAVCKKGDVLGSGQTTLLKTFGVAMSRFKVELVACYDRKAEQVTTIEPLSEDEEDDEDDEPEEDGGMEVE